MIIAIEGLDGSGKTTVGKLLAQLLGARFITLPPPDLRLVDHALFGEVNSEARYAYYVAGVLSVSEQDHSSELMVADRFVASAHAMHLYVKSPLAGELASLSLPTAEFTIYLDVEETERRRRTRLGKRKPDKFEELLESDEQFREGVARKMQSFEPTVIIDTTGVTPEGVALEARRRWELHRSRNAQ